MSGVCAAARQRLLVRGVLLVCVWGLSGVAWAKRGRTRRVQVRVVDLVADAAFVRPGADAGILPGQMLRFGKRRYKVTHVSADFARVATPRGQLRLQARGFVRVPRRSKDKAPGRKLAPVKSYAGLWPPSEPPAKTADPPAYVPLGRRDGTAALRLRLTQHSAAVLPLEGGDAVLRGALRARLDYASRSGRPWFAQVDASLLGWRTPTATGSAARPFYRLRSLHAGYGRRHGTHVALGRLPFVTAQLGALDGVSGRYALTDRWSLQAFAGAPPRVRDHAPSFEAARSGATLRYVDLDSAWRPEWELGGHVSVFEGQLDEQRLYTRASLYPAFGHLSGEAELSFFDADNPWQASRVTLSAAALDAGWRYGVLFAGARVDLRRLEQSYWLDAALPRNFLCGTRPEDEATASEAERCGAADSLRYWTSAEFGLEFDAIRVSTRAGVLHFEDDPGNASLSSDTQLRWVHPLGVAGIDRLYVDGGGFWTRADLLRTYGARLALGAWWLSQRGDLALHYQPQVARYGAERVRWLEHRTGASFHVAVLPTLRLGAQAEVVTGRDVDAIYLMSHATWAPRLGSTAAE